MSGEKRKTVDYDWIDENIRSKIPTEYIEKLPAGSLNPEDIVQIFNRRLQLGVDFEFADEDVLEIPTELESTFAKYHSVIGLSLTPNEALARSFINLVIFNYILQERIIINNPEKKAPAQPTSSSTILSYPPRVLQKAPLQHQDKISAFTLRREFGKLIVSKAKDYILSGIADYSLGYNDAGTGPGNLVVVEAKKCYHLNRAYGQLLAYMGL